MSKCFMLIVSFVNLKHLLYLSSIFNFRYIFCDGINFGISKRFLIVTVELSFYQLELFLTYLKK